MFKSRADPWSNAKREWYFFFLPWWTVVHLQLWEQECSGDPGGMPLASLLFLLSVPFEVSWSCSVVVPENPVL